MDQKQADQLKKVWGLARDILGTMEDIRPRGGFDELVDRPSPLVIKIQKTLNTARMPTKAYETDAGWDLYCADRIKIYPRGIALVSTGIALEIPAGWYGQIQGRSGLSSEGFDVFGGVVDSGYTGTIYMAIAHSGHRQNHMEEPYRIFEVGEKIAQIVFLPVPKVQFVEVDRLNESSRGEKGFGSTGK